jgi:hypothetical protein
MYLLPNPPKGEEMAQRSDRGKMTAPVTCDRFWAITSDRIAYEGLSYEEFRMTFERLIAAREDVRALLSESPDNEGYGLFARTMTVTRSYRLNERVFPARSEYTYQWWGVPKVVDEVIVPFPGERPVLARYPLGQDDIYRKSSVRPGVRRFVLVRPKLTGWRYTRPLPVGVTSDRVIPNYTAWHWLALIEGKKAQTPAVPVSTEIVPHVLSRRGMRQFWAIWSGVSQKTPSRVFVVDADGLTIPWYNDRIRRVSVVPPSKNRAETWCPDLTSFEVESAQMVADRTNEYEMDRGGDLRALPHGLPWEVFSDRDFEEITKKARITAHWRDQHRTYRYAHNVLDDVIQDACIWFAHLLQESQGWQVMYRSAQGYPVAFWFVPKSTDLSAVDLFEEDDEDGTALAYDEASEAFVQVKTDIEDEVGFMVTRGTLYSWSVKTALKRYGLDRLGEKRTKEGKVVESTAILGEDPQTLPLDQRWGIVPRSRPMYLNTAYTRQVSTNPMDAATWGMAWQDGRNYPILNEVMRVAQKRPSATKAAIMRQTAQKRLNSDKVTAKGINVVKGRASEEYEQLRTDLNEVRKSWRTVFNPDE